MKINRREFLKKIQQWSAAASLALVGTYLMKRKGQAFCTKKGLNCQGCIKGDGCTLSESIKKNGYLWQLDPQKCIQCGNCATACVLLPSAVKCVHNFSMCGYCDRCSGYLITGSRKLDTAAENQMCPTGALKRKFIEDPYFEYTIDETLCLGCGRCVKGCDAFGNSSLYLQVKHNICVNCNECSIARQCPSRAFRRVPRDESYLLKSQIEDGKG